MFKLVLLSLQIAAILCAPAQEDAVAGDKNIPLNNAVTEKRSEKTETAQVEGIPEGAKADTGADDDEQPQKDSGDNKIDIKLCTNNGDCNTVTGTGNVASGYRVVYTPTQHQQQDFAQSEHPVASSMTEQLQLMESQANALQRELNAMRFGTKGNSGLFREVGRYSSGSKGQVQREVQPSRMSSKGQVQREVQPFRMGSKGQTNLLREAGRYPAGSKGQSVLREIGESQPSLSCSLTQYELETTKLLNTNLKEQLENATHYGDKLTSQHNDIDRALTSAQLYNSKLRSENAALAAENGRLRVDNEALVAENNNLKNVNANLRAENANLIRNNNELQSRNSVLQRENMVLKQETSMLQAQNEALRMENTNLKNSNENLRAENAALREQVRNLQNQVKNLEDAASVLQAQVADLNNRLSNCNADKATLEAAKARLLTTIANLQAEISNLKRNLANLRAENVDLQVANNKLMEQNLKLNEDLVSFSASISLQRELMARCPIGYDRFGTKCYKYVKEKREWKLAQEYCMREGGNLASINSVEEQQVVTDLLKRVGARKDDYYIFIGGEEIRGQWQWVDSGSGFGYPQEWYHGRPRNVYRDKCLTMYMYSPKKYGKWLNMRCNLVLPSVCEVDIGQSGPIVDPYAALLTNQLEAKHKVGLTQGFSTNQLEAFIPMKDTSNVQAMDVGNTRETSGGHRKSIYVMMPEENTQ